MKQNEEMSLHAALVGRSLLHWTIFLALSFGGGIWLESVRHPELDLANRVQSFWNHGGIFMLIATVVMVSAAFDMDRFSRRFTERLSRVGNALRQLAAGEEAAEIEMENGDDEIDELAECYNSFRARYFSTGLVEDEEQVEARSEEKRELEEARIAEEAAEQKRRDAEDRIAAEAAILAAEAAAATAEMESQYPDQPHIADVIAPILQARQDQHAEETQEAAKAKEEPAVFDMNWEDEA